MTVVCNVRDEAQRLPDVLAMLESQERPPDRVVVVDDGSRDATPQILTGYDGPLPLDVITLPPVGLAPARLTGLDAVDDGIAVVVDADMEIPPGWLAAVAERFEADPRLGGLSSRVARSGTGRWARGGQAAREVVAWIRARSPRPWMVGHGMALRVAAYRQAGLDADPLTAEDLALSEALAAAGWRLGVLDHPPIATVDPDRVAGIWRRHLLVGRRTAVLLARHRTFRRRASTWARFLPVALVAAGLVAPRLAAAATAGTTTGVVVVMRRRGVPCRDVPWGVAVLGIQLGASTVGTLLGGAELLASAVSRGTATRRTRRRRG